MDEMEMYEEEEEDIRTGYETGIGRVGFQKFDFRKKDPRALAAYNLNKALSRYPDFTLEARTAIQNEFSDMPNIEVMNMDTLAAVLYFLKYNPESERKPEDFKDENIVEYFENLFPDRMDKKEKERFIIRLKAQFLKYLSVILSFRSKDNQV